MRPNYNHVKKPFVESFHGLRTPNEAFFIEIQNFWVWADKLGPLSMFSIIQPLFLQKKTKLTIFGELGFEFGS